MNEEENMKLLSVNAHNFLSFEDLSLDLDNQGLVLLDGTNKDSSDGAFQNNGVGKSTFLASIFYAIYGETPDGRSANNVINRDKGKDTKVTLSLEVGGHNYRIERGRKKNFTKLFEDDKELEYSTMKETQNAIENLIGIPEEVFRTTLFFDGHYTTPFSEMTDKQKKEFLSAVVDLEVYTKAHEKTKEDIKGVNLEIDQVDFKIDTINKSTSQYTSLLEENKASLAKADADIANLEQQQKDFETNSEEYDKLLTSINEIESKLANFTVNTTSVEQDKLNELSNKLNSANSNKLQATSAFRDANYQLDNIKSQIEQGKSTYVNYKELASKAYDKENLTEAYHYGDIGASKDTLDTITPNAFDTAKIDAIKQQLGNLITQYKQLEVKQEQAEMQVKETTEAYEELVAQVNTQKALADKEVQANNSKLSEYQQANNQLQQLKQQQQLHVNQLNAIQSQLNNAKSTKEYVQHQLESLTPATDADVDSLRQQKETLIANRIKLEHALEAFSDKGIKSHVLDLVTPTLNEGVNKYLSILSGGLIEAQFTTQTKKADGTFSDKLDIDVLYNGEETDYNSLSSGEKRRVDIAISLSLQDMVMTRFGDDINLLAYDELFESLDAVGSENVIELLRQKLKDVSTIIIISHNEDLKPLFDKTIMVTKEQGISTLKVIN